MKKRLSLSLLVLCINYTWAQIAVSGKITNKAGEALAGVTVYEKGTNNGLYSNDDGTYQITCQDNNSVLVFENLGYSTLEVMPNGKTPLDLGGSNIFNVYPTKQDIETESGGRWDSVQMGFGGAMWFARLRWKF